MKGRNAYLDLRLIMGGDSSNVGLPGVDGR